MNLHLPAKHFRISFPAIDCEQDFEQLASNLHGEILDRETIHLSDGLTGGLVKKVTLQAGCCLRAWNVEFNHAVELYKTGNHSDNKSFTFIYVLTPGCCRLKSIGANEQFNPAQVRSTLMIANDIDLCFEIIPAQLVRVVEISVTAFWLARQFREAGLALEPLLDRIHDTQHPMILHNTCSAWVINQVNLLFDNLLHVRHDDSRVKEVTVSLTLDFLNKSLNTDGRTVNEQHAPHLGKIMEAEAILQAHLQRNLPNVNDIAQRVSLSESTLKRHFKIIFGKSLYEYYLEKKMNLAKTLLQEQPLTVYETAARLGYEKVSNFIGIFKKHHGYSPGSIKRKGLHGQTNGI